MNLLRCPQECYKVALGPWRLPIEAVEEEEEDQKGRGGRATSSSCSSAEVAFKRISPAAAAVYEYVSYLEEAGYIPKKGGTRQRALLIPRPLHEALGTDSINDVTPVTEAHWSAKLNNFVMVSLSKKELAVTIKETLNFDTFKSFYIALFGTTSWKYEGQETPPTDTPADIASKADGVKNKVEIDPSHLAALKRENDLLRKENRALRESKEVSQEPSREEEPGHGRGEPIELQGYQGGEGLGEGSRNADVGPTMQQYKEIRTKRERDVARLLKAQTLKVPTLTLTLTLTLIGGSEGWRRPEGRYDGEHVREVMAMGESTECGRGSNS